MRSVKRRKPAPSRAAVKRRGATRGRVAEAREAFNKRKAPRDNIISRTWNAVRARLSFRRPFLLITGSLLALTVIGALFIGGHVSRTFQAMGGGVQAVLDPRRLRRLLHADQRQQPHAAEHHLRRTRFRGRPAHLRRRPAGGAGRG